MDVICDTDQLEAVVGTRPLAAMMKSLDHLDEHCATLLAASPLAVAGFTDTDGRDRARIVGGAAGFADVASRTTLDLGEELPAAPGSPVSTLFLLPGWGETLRINGSVHPSSQNQVAVSEAFVHCAKAIIRSELWTAPPAAELPAAPDGHADSLGEAMSAFVASSPFVVVTSQDLDGNADASPKGDPPGFVRVLDPSTIAIPDRKGNRRTDTFHNLIERPEVVVLVLRPGDDRVLEIDGTAHLTDDRALCESMAVKGRAPHAALVVDVDRCELRSSPTIVEAGLWDPDRRVDAAALPRASAIWTDHVAANPTTGPAAAAVRAAARERAVRAGVAVDYRRNLY